MGPVLARSDHLGTRDMSPLMAPSEIPLLDVYNKTQLDNYSSDHKLIDYGCNEIARRTDGGIQVAPPCLSYRPAPNHQIKMSILESNESIFG